MCWYLWSRERCYSAAARARGLRRGFWRRVDLQQGCFWKVPKEGGGCNPLRLPGRGALLSKSGKASAAGRSPAHLRLPSPVPSTGGNRKQSQRRKKGGLPSPILSKTRGQQKAVHLKLPDDHWKTGNTWNPFIKISFRVQDVLDISQTRALIPNIFKGRTSFPGDAQGKNLPAMQDMPVQSLGWEDPLDPQSSCLDSFMDKGAWGWGELQSMGVTENQTWVSKNRHIDVSFRVISGCKQFTTSLWF